jgi:RNA-directed DNA polymerase
VVSPQLANIALDGMERWLGQWTNLRTYINKTGKQMGQVHKQANPRYGYVRFADDFIITAATREEIEAIQPQVVAWLAERGLDLNQEKTHIRNIEDGFNFLGFNIRRYGTKCLVKPQKEKVQAKLREIKQWLVMHPNVGPDDVIDVLNPILRGWANYYKHGVSKRMFATFSHRLTLLLMRWARRRHPGKGGRWVIPRYFTRVGGNNWVFYAKTKDRHGKITKTYLYQIGHTLITRHIKTKGAASPDDPALADYWTARQTRYGKSYFAVGSKLYRVAARQGWRCPLCRRHLFNEERIHIHHEQAVAEGGTDEEDNLCILHAACHRTTFGRRPATRSEEA